jgi:hypothetical protein
VKLYVWFWEKIRVAVYGSKGSVSARVSQRSGGMGKRAGGRDSAVVFE